MAKDKNKSKLPRWEVGLPLVGIVYYRVRAKNKEDAIRKAFNCDFNKAFERGDVEIETVREIATGNVLHARHNTAYASEIKPKKESDNG